jgi:hypothetical protein
MLDIAVATKPIRAMKVSRIVMDRGGSIVFAPTFHRSYAAMFRASDRAVCAAFAAHTSPDLSCTCGFYAVADLENLHRFAPVPHAAVALSVALGGYVIEHDFGVRASHQLVEELYLPDRCVRCGDATPCAFMVQPSWHLERELHAVCILCARTAPRRVLSLSDVASRLGVSVREVPLKVSHLWQQEPSRWVYALVTSSCAMLTASVAALYGFPLIALLAVAPLMAGYLTLLVLAQPLRRRFRIAQSARSLLGALRFVCSPVRYRTSR